MLIPGAIIYHYGVDGPEGLGFDWDVVLPETVDLTRFKIYADFVKVARMHMPLHPSLLDKTALPTSLLPNLQRLVFSTCGPTPPTDFDWVSKLLAPDLLAFEVHSIPLQESDGEDLRREHAWMKRERCFELIEHISRKCPHLETLRIFPGEPDSLGTGVDSTKYREITSLKHLRTLALGATEIDQELFLALVQLPHLETLSLHTDPFQPAQTKCDPIAIPDDSFLALRHLGLYGLSESSIQRVCTLSPLFRHLVKASIVSPDYYYHSKIADKHAFSRSIAQCFSRNSPHLVDLTVFSPRSTSSIALYLPVTVDALKSMPLRRLRLDRARLKSWGDADELDSDDSDVGEEIGGVGMQWSDFLAAVPHLEELHLDLQYIKSRRLPVIASTLPNLRLLVLMCVLFDEDMDATIGGAATQPITIRCPIYVNQKGEINEEDTPRMT
ncbi:hypothetical protein FRC06_006511, partial [Ceratobasidium sp. 370]